MQFSPSRARGFVRCLSRITTSVRVLPNRNGGRKAFCAGLASYQPYAPLRISFRHRKVRFSKSWLVRISHPIPDESRFAPRNGIIEMWPKLPEPKKPHSDNRLIRQWEQGEAAIRYPLSPK